MVKSILLGSKKTYIKDPFWYQSLNIMQHLLDSLSHLMNPKTLQTRNGGTAG